MIIKVKKKLTSADLVDLDQFLRAHTKDMDLIKAHGLITAIISLPDDIGHDEWLPLIVGGIGNFQDKKFIQKILSILVTIYGKTALNLQKLAEPFRFIFDTNNFSEDFSNIDEPQISKWCSGYCMALNWFGIEAYLEDESSSCQHNCGNMFLLANPNAYGPDLYALEDEEGIESTEALEKHWNIIKMDLISDLPNIVRSLFSFWMREYDLENKKKSDNTYNCPCNSGKIFEECCMLDVQEAILH